MTSSASPLSSISSASVDVLVENKCFWIHDALTMEEQIEVFEEILERSKHTDNRQKAPCMNPSPKTLLFDGPTPTLRFGRSGTHTNDGGDDGSAPSVSLSSVFEKLILRRAFSLASRHLRPIDGAAARFAYDRHSVGVIRYAAPHGRFPEHVDHCNAPRSWVALLSLGCTARFAVRGPADAARRVVGLRTGDVLVFDPSSAAAIAHGVEAIDPGTCPEALVSAFGEEVMADRRYGIQCRTSISSFAALHK